jgi:hypothetical protein
VAVLAAACSGSDEGASAPGTTQPVVEAVTPPPTAPVSTLPMPEGFVIPDTRNVVLPPIESDERAGDAPDPSANVLAVRGGRATLRVRVDGPDARSGGLVVRFERFDGGLRGWEDVRAGRDGVAVLTEAMGGRYRVRAWRRPDLTSTESQAVFVGFDQELEVRVRVERHDALIVQGALAVGAWQVGDVVPFQVLVVREEVDGEGIIRGAPQSLAVEVRQIVGAAVEEPRVAVTDPGSGFATFAARCDLPGEHRLVLVGGPDEIEVLLPPCAPRPEPVTTTTAPTTTSTTRPRSDP